jgi:hypothetical protein
MAELPDKSLVVTNKSKETSDIFRVGRLWLQTLNFPSRFTPILQELHLDLDYLYGTQFTVLTDNNPMTYVLTTAKLDATRHRW